MVWPGSHHILDSASLLLFALVPLISLVSGGSLWEPSLCLPSITSKIHGLLLNTPHFIIIVYLTVRTAMADTMPVLFSTWFPAPSKCLAHSRHLTSICWMKNWKENMWFLSLNNFKCSSQRKIQNVLPSVKIMVAWNWKGCLEKRWPGYMWVH